jgi:hypothetical protein
MSEIVELTSTNSHVLTSSSSGQNLVSLLSRKVVGQSTVTNIIVPYVYMFQSGLAPTGRPAVADLLHGSELNSMRRARCKQGEILARGKRDDGQGEVVVPLLQREEFSRRKCSAI